MLLEILICHSMAVVALIRIGIYVGSGCVTQLNPVGTVTLLAAQGYLLIWQVITWRWHSSASSYSPWPSALRLSFEGAKTIRTLTLRV
jgi:hypothetical protein